MNDLITDALGVALIGGAMIGSIGLIILGLRVLARALGLN